MEGEIFPLNANFGNTLLVFELRESESSTLAYVYIVVAKLVYETNNCLTNYYEDLGTTPHKLHNKQVVAQPNEYEI